MIIRKISLALLYSPSTCLSKNVLASMVQANRSSKQSAIKSKTNTKRRVLIKAWTSDLGFNLSKKVCKEHLMKIIKSCLFRERSSSVCISHGIDDGWV